MRARYPGRFLPCETYTYTMPNVGYLSWDVTRAKAFMAEGRAIGWDEIPRDQLERIATTWQVDDAIVAEADPRLPGIAAPMLDQGHRVYVVIGGVHRATRAYRDGVPFRVLVLSVEESRACLIEAPPGSVP